MLLKVVRCRGRAHLAIYVAGVLEPTTACTDVVRRGTIRVVSQLIHIILTASRHKTPKPRIAICVLQMTMTKFLVLNATKVTMIDDRNTICVPTKDQADLRGTIRVVSQLIHTLCIMKACCHKTSKPRIANCSYKCP